MNYDYFSQLEAGTLTKAENETEQAFMERFLSAVFAEKTDELSNRLNDKMAPRFVGCNAEERSMSVSFTAREWMLNPNGTLHGGMISAATDMVLSILARYLSKKRVMVTAQLSMNFLRVIQENDTFTVHATAEHVGRRSAMVQAYVTVNDTDKHAATASAVLM